MSQLLNIGFDALPFVVALSLAFSKRSQTKSERRYTLIAAGVIACAGIIITLDYSMKFSHKVEDIFSTTTSVLFGFAIGILYCIKDQKRVANVDAKAI
jgi:hypothetical protein